MVGHDFGLVAFIFREQLRNDYTPRPQVGCGAPWQLINWEPGQVGTFWGVFGPVWLHFFFYLKSTYESYDSYHGFFYLGITSSNLFFIFGEKIIPPRTVPRITRLFCTRGTKFLLVLLLVVLTSRIFFDDSQVREFFCFVKSPEFDYWIPFGTTIVVQIYDRS